MKVIKVESFDQLKDGDNLLIESTTYGGMFYKDIKIKITQNDGREIILQKKGNHYFNWNIYEQGLSHVQSIYKIDFEIVIRD